MSSRVTRSLALVLVFLSGIGALHAAPSGGEARGLLWKIEGASQSPSYLFGTIHIADPRVINLPPLVRTTFETADSLLVEVVPDLESMGRLAQAMRFSDGHTLPQTVGPRLAADARAALAKRHLPITDADKLKPWAIALMLLTPDLNGALPLDLVLQSRASERGVDVAGLETMDEQIAVFDGLSADDQRSLLEVTLRESSEIGERTEALTQAYLERDLAKLQALTETDELGNGALHDTVMRRLLTERNRRMVDRMRSRLRQGNVFIAVGAAHLPGPQGLLELLKREGYRLSAVY